MKSLLIAVLLFGYSIPAFAQATKQPKPEADKAPADQKEGPPPSTLEEAHQHLEKLLPKDALAKIDAMKSEDEMIMYHHGLGTGLRNDWGLWGGGPLAQHMKTLGFHHPDDMSSVILETFWCKRHKKDFRLKERAALFKAYWQAMADPPPTAKDPKDGSEIEWNMTLIAGDDTNPRGIHAGKSKKTGRWLVYEHDKGVYEPDAALLKRIKE